MRKTILFLALGVLLLAGTVDLSVHGAWMGKEDQGFRDVYGNGAWAYGIRGEVKIFGPWHVYGGYDYLSKKGKTVLMGEEASTVHNYYSVGLEYVKGFPLVSLLARAGVLFVDYSEEALGQSIRDNCVGFEAMAGLRLKLRPFFIEGGAGYMAASDRILDSDIKFNGIKLEVGVGVGF